ncbi:hypothetical protein [Sphingomonas sp. ACRSK]|uniref:hypothetical protein n=1 Tax=Sphingomonas sp. ACRSK TaxID=2918213 RepID=UPI001EF40A78|nr:hypothetical protein [Sphingomonas sp. ACRSK]MCG7348849.1 hypothetical protein [Sphingomonas sp. ACRSK]
MNHRTFRSVIDDIERNLDTGEGYTLHIRTRTGDVIRDRAWEGLKGSSSFTHEFEVIVLSQPDRPPLYLPLAQIESLELAS